MKLYIQKKGREIVRAARDGATLIVTSTVAYAEARSALARVRREAKLDPTQYSAVVTALERDWSACDHIDADERLAFRAGKLAETHGLRGFDAIHLATALRARKIVGDVRFLAFDVRLMEAAEREGLGLYQKGVEHSSR